MLLSGLRDLGNGRCQIDSLSKTSGRAEKWTNKQTNGQTYKQTQRLTDKQT
jgi:hypothetical protein